MWEPNKALFDQQLQKVVAEESFIDEMYKRSGVPRYVTRNMLLQHGLSAQVVHALREAGFFVPYHRLEQTDQP